MNNRNGLSMIGGEFGAPGGTSFRAFDPIANAAFGPEFHSASHSDVDRACVNAAEAASAFARSTGEQRALLLESIAQHIDAAVPQLVAVTPHETGLPEARVRSETARTCAQMRLFASLLRDGTWLDARIEHGDAKRTPIPKPDVRSMLLPLGPVAVFGASNFPLAYSVAGGDTASALASGCPVVVKAHPAHPGTSEIIGLAIQKAIRECGVDEAVFSLLYDAWHTIGSALVTHPAIRAVGFTGSQRGGRALLALANQRPDPIPVFAEMGSVNPIFLLPEALAEHAEDIAKGLFNSVTATSGQFCTKPGLVFAVNGSDYERMRSVLETSFRTAPSGPMLTPMIAAAYRDGRATLSRHIDVRTLAQGDGNETFGAPALFETQATTLLANPELAQEVFGPSTLLVCCESVAQFIIIAQQLEGQLTATLHAQTSEWARYPDLLEILQRRAGRVLFGGFPTGVEVSHAIVHGGPWPATSDGRSTSVGSAAILRWVRPVAFQNFPDSALPPALQEENPLRLPRLVDGRHVGR